MAVSNERVVVALRAKRDELLKQVHQLDDTIEMLGGTNHTEPRRRNLGNTGQGARALEILRKAQGEISLKDIMKEIRKDFKNANPNSVHSSLMNQAKKHSLELLVEGFAGVKRYKLK